MRFSLRSLFLLVTLLAGSLLAVSGYDGVARDRSRVEELNNEIEDLSQALLISDPQRHLALVHSLEEFDSLHAIREQMVTNAGAVRERYSGLEKRHAETLSLRRIPVLEVDPSCTRLEFKLIAPATRPVWLKFAVHSADTQPSNGPSNDQSDVWMKTSPLENSGPFEFKLLPGEQLLSLCEKRLEDGRRLISLKMGQQPLLETNYLQESTGHSTSSISAPNQLDFEANQDLPWLLTFDIETNSTNQSRSNPFAYSIWLSDQPSQFDNVEIMSR